MSPVGVPNAEVVVAEMLTTDPKSCGFGDPTHTVAVAGGVTTTCTVLEVPAAKYVSPANFATICCTPIGRSTPDSVAIPNPFGVAVPMRVSPS